MTAASAEPTATAPDYDEIVHVVQLYVDGFNCRDVDKFKQAFHESAWIFFTLGRSTPCMRPSMTM